MRNIFERVLRSIFRNPAYLLLCDALIFFYTQIKGPWIVANFYAAWEYYQHDTVYRQRITLFGFKFAYENFLNDKISQRYCLRKRIEMEPSLRFRILFLPWSIPKPDIFDTAMRSGVI